jgi:hypothetical protein
MSPLRLVSSDDPRHTFVLHLVLYLLINTAYLVRVGWRWLWVAGIWGIGLAVHAAVAITFSRNKGRGAAIEATEATE